MDPKEVQRMCGRVSQLLAERLGARGHSLADRIASRHRSLPRKVRRAARRMVEAEAMLGAPKLVHQIDAGALRHAYHTCTAFLEPLDAAARWGRRLRDIAATVVIGLLVLAGIGLLVIR